MLQMERTGLRNLQPNFLQGTGKFLIFRFSYSMCISMLTDEHFQILCFSRFISTGKLGLYRIEIAHNPLSDIPDSAFDGLERTLWELAIHHNQLIEVPSRALRNLKKLKYLDLSGNQINCIELDSFSGLDGSLERLILADNTIDSIPRDAFSSLPKLETIDLSGNNIAYLDPKLFQDGMPALAKVFSYNYFLISLSHIENRWICLIFESIFLSFC